MRGQSFVLSILYFPLNYITYIIKTKKVFFWTSNLKGNSFHVDKATIVYLTSEYYSLSVLSEKLYFLEIGPVDPKLLPFKYVMMKTSNLNFLDYKKTP